MNPLTKTQMLILNSALDDWENLEQIYRSICLEFSPERYNPSDSNSFYWREATAHVPLSELVDELRSLVDHGLLSVRDPDSKVLPAEKSDASYLWRGWFSTTPEGRSRLLSQASRQL